MGLTLFWNCNLTTYFTFQTFCVPQSLIMHCSLTTSFGVFITQYILMGLRFCCLAVVRSMPVRILRSFSLTSCIIRVDEPILHLPWQCHETDENTRSPRELELPPTAPDLPRLAIHVRQTKTKEARGVESYLQLPQIRPDYPFL